MRAAALAAAVFVYCLVASALPDVPVGVDGAIGTLLIFAVVLSAARVGDAPPAALLMVLGAGMTAGALNAAGADAAATVPVAITCACVGALFARGLEVPALVLVLPLVVAVIDAVSVGSGGAPIASGDGGGGLLSLQVPAWGGGAALHIGIADPIFAAVFWTWAHRLGLRERATFTALLAASGLAVVLVLSLKVTVPALPLLAAAFYLPNLDLLGGLMLRGSGGAGPGTRSRGPS